MAVVCTWVLSRPRWWWSEGRSPIPCSCSCCSIDSQESSSGSSFESSRRSGRDRDDQGCSSSGGIIDGAAQGLVLQRNPVKFSSRRRETCTGRGRYRGTDWGQTSAATEQQTPMTRSFFLCRWVSTGWGELSRGWWRQITQQAKVRWELRSEEGGQ